jgi:hypothetical protein
LAQISLKNVFQYFLTKQLIYMWQVQPVKSGELLLLFFFLLATVFKISTKAYFNTLLVASIRFRCLIRKMAPKCKLFWHFVRNNEIHTNNIPFWLVASVADLNDICPDPNTVTPIARIRIQPYLNFVQNFVHHFVKNWPVKFELKSHT